MLKGFLFLLIYLWISYQSFAQSDTIPGDGVFYFSIEDALKEPEKVTKLTLKGKGLKEFPLEILTFQNLKILLLSGEYDMPGPDISQSERDEWAKKLPPGSVDLIRFDVDPDRRNYIKKIPKEIAALKNLMVIDVGDNDLSKRQIRRLKRLLPKCEVVY